ncbi:hypothetical protein QYE76_047600 [Lolium multiflorum]|uniref:Uncharacterized protein n=1 Tax=Lolium multiflorum TaxID=4521 RepID=A0AAD8TS19_LOLMU|nr:hypothetical protein QYE76_047600 [Lolium multiflorum]
MSSWTAPVCLIANPRPRQSTRSPSSPPQTVPWPRMRHLIAASLVPHLTLTRPSCSILFSSAFTCTLRGILIGLRSSGSSATFVVPWTSVSLSTPPPPRTSSPTRTPIGPAARHASLHVWLLVYFGPSLISGRLSDSPRSLARPERSTVANAVAEVSWLRQLLVELSCPVAKATLVYCDNVSAVYLSANPVHHRRTKHIELDIHFVREQVALGHIRVLHVPTSQQFADIMTKGLPMSRTWPIYVPPYASDQYIEHCISFYNLGVECRVGCPLLLFLLLRVSHELRVPDQVEEVVGVVVVLQLLVGARDRGRWRRGSLAAADAGHGKGGGCAAATLL